MAEQGLQQGNASKQWQKVAYDKAGKDYHGSVLQISLAIMNTVGPNAGSCAE